MEQTNPNQGYVFLDNAPELMKLLEDIRNRWPEYDVHCEGACSSCQALLTLNMETLKAIGIYDENKGMTVVAGCDNKLDPSIPDKQIILHGNCTRRHLKEHPDAYFLPGAPG